MAKQQTVVQCVSCGDLKIDDKWYRSRRAPSHEPTYKGGMCPDCKDKKAKRVIGVPLLGPTVKMLKEISKFNERNHNK